MTTCKNCEHDFDGNFCNNCGQKAKTARLDWHYVLDEAKYTFLHFNGGLTYTIKQLVTRPGHAVFDYVSGKRVHHYKPVLLVFVLAGIYGVLMHYVSMEAAFRSMSGEKATVDFQIKIYEWQVNHYSLIEVLNLPIAALLSWITFRKWKYNFVEHLILNAFATALRLLFNIAAFPILYVLTKFGALGLTMLLGLAGFGLTVWTYKQFFSHDKAGRITPRLLLLLLLYFAVLVIVIITMTAVLIIFHPDKLGIR